MIELISFSPVSKNSSKRHFLPFLSGHEIIAHKGSVFPNLVQFFFNSSRFINAPARAYARGLRSSCFAGPCSHPHPSRWGTPARLDYVGKIQSLTPNSKYLLLS